jgi:hypothetical protein
MSMGQITANAPRDLRAGQPHFFSPCQIGHMYGAHDVVILIQHRASYCETDAAIIQEVT